MTRLVDRRNYWVIHPMKGFGTSPQDPLPELIRRILEQPRTTILDCSALAPPMDTPTLDRIFFLEQQLRSSNRKLNCVHATQGLKASIDQTGKNLPFFETLEAALEDLSASQIDTSSRQFIKAFVNATLRTFFVQAKTESKRGNIQVKAKDTSRPLGDISGIVKVIGRSLYYAVFLSFPKDTFLKLVERLLGETHTEINAENQDAAAEFMNIIFGQAKLVLNLKGAGLMPQVPTISTGGIFEGLEFEAGTPSHLEDGKTVVIPFESELGDFFIEVWFPSQFSDQIV